MCGRIFVDQTPGAAEMLRALDLGHYQLPTHNNVAPTEPVPVVFAHEGGYDLAPMRWWLHPGWSPEPPNQKFAMFNARIETVLSSRAYKGPIQYRRGIVPAAGFVEWQKTPDGKQPYYINSEDGVLRLAAVWECWQDQLWSCSIITQPASEDFAPVHNRMPLSLNNEQMLQWLDHSQNPKKLVSSFKGLSQRLDVHKVDRSVNDARNKSPISLISVPD